jgi:hypothetical protein
LQGLHVQRQFLNLLFKFCAVDRGWDFAAKPIELGVGIAQLKENR